MEKMNCINFVRLVCWLIVNAWMKFSDKSNKQCQKIVLIRIHLWLLLFLYQNMYGPLCYMQQIDKRKRKKEKKTANQTLQSNKNQQKIFYEETQKKKCYSIAVMTLNSMKINTELSSIYTYYFCFFKWWTF